VVFAVNALSVVGVIVVLVRWKGTVPERNLPAEHIIGAMRAGLRYAIRAPDLKVVLIPVVGVSLKDNALWALPPGVARPTLARGPAGLGRPVGFLGARRAQRDVA